MGRKTDLNTLNVTNALIIIASRNVQHSRDGGRGACRWPHRFPSPPHMARWHHQPVLMEKGGQEVSTPQAGGVWAEVVSTISRLGSLNCPSDSPPCLHTWLWMLLDASWWIWQASISLGPWVTTRSSLHPIITPTPTSVRLDVSEK